MIQHITKPFKEFFKLEASSGIVLLIAAILALIISNGSYSDDYFSILKKYITLGTESFGLKLSVLHWINDVLMAVFFFFVSLEIKTRIFTRRTFKSKTSITTNYRCSWWNGSTCFILYIYKFF